MAKKVSEAQLHITGKDKTKTAFNSVQGRLKRMKDSLLGVKGAMGLLGVASAGVFVKMAKDAANTADEIRKMSGRIGITTDALQEMRFAFGLAGVEGDVLNKGLLNFSKSLGEARVGTGALTTFLKKSDEALLGQLVSAKNTTKALDIFFGALGRTKNQSDKMALSSAALGRAGKLITTAFEGGADAFANAREEAHRLGLIIDQELLENAEAMNDQLSIVSQVISVQLTKAFLELAPAIQSSAKALTEFLVGMKNGESILFHNNQKMSLFERIVRSIAFELDKAGMAFSKLIGNEKLFEFYKKLALEQRELILLSQRSIDLSKKAPGVSGAIPPMSKLQPLHDSRKKLCDKIPKPVEAPYMRGEEQFSLIELLDSVLEDIRGPQEKLEDEIRQSSIRELAILEQQASGHEEIAVLFEKQFEVEDKLGRKLTEREGNELEAFLAQKKHLEEIITINEQVGGISERVFDRMGDGLVNALQRGEGAFDSLKNVALAALFDIGQELFRIAAIAPLKKAAGSFLGSIDFGSILGGFFADGGFVSGAKPILVGERGPEIFSPGASGSIIP
ncbi:MAG: hypothetical protein H8E32_10640, partial [Nitrospinae bacterium]|nr:hypothetical protein [Nitrospinota bacterium]